MRILLIGTGVQPIPPDGYGGIERSIAEYAEALRRAGHAVRVVNEVRKGRMRDEYPFARNLSQLVIPGSFDVVHASTPVVAHRLARLRWPYIYTTHSRHWFIRRGLTQRWGYFLERRAVRRSAATIALTSRLAETIEHAVGGGIRARVEVIPLGVDGELFQPEWTARTGTVALGVGVVVPIKRWELAAAALRGTAYTFRLVGPIVDPVYAAKIRAMGDRIELLGELSEEAVRREFARADVLVHPSQVEVLPGAVLQGMAAGLPILGTEAISSVVDEAGTGWCAPAGTGPPEIVQFLHDRVEALYRDSALRRSLGTRAREVALSKYDWSEVVRRHIRVYERFVVGRVSPPESPAK